MKKTFKTIALAAGVLGAMVCSAENKEQPKFVFTSIPDFLNFDVGDISKLDTFDGGKNSTNESLEKAIGKVLDSMKAENPAFVLAAGDIVNGLWEQNAGRTIFSPTVKTDEGRKQNINNAADLYYGDWKKRFTDRGLVYHVAIGDHEIGDDSSWGQGGGKRGGLHAKDFKDAFARHFTKNKDGKFRYKMRPVGTPYENTAYAFTYKNSLFVSVDVFSTENPENEPAGHGRQREVIPTMRKSQLDWLDEIFGKARKSSKIKHIIVQGHTPVLAPVRRSFSSGITLRGHEKSDFWKLLEKHEVDLYIAGEVHAITARNSGVVEQISHGCLFAQGRPKHRQDYMVGKVYDDRIELEIKQADVAQSGKKNVFYQVRGDGGFENVEVGDFKTIGTLTIDKSGEKTQYLNRTGALELYTK